MTTSHEGIKRVVELWALGLSGEETAKTMRDEGFKIAVATVYRLRHSFTAQQMLDELIRRQLRDIATADPPLKLKYRDKLLEKMLPQKIEAQTASTLTIASTPFDADPEMRKLLLEAAAKQRAEKDAHLHALDARKEA